MKSAFRIGRGEAVPALLGVMAGAAILACAGCAIGNNSRAHLVVPVNLNLWKSSSVSAANVDGASMGSNTISNAQEIEGGGSVQASGIPEVKK